LKRNEILRCAQDDRKSEETTMRNIWTGVVAFLGVVGGASMADAQTLKMMKSLDAPHYDGARTTWSPSSDIVNMFQDTLVAMDWDGKTPIPYLAKSWTVSPDGKLYTFKLRDDVTFCSGRKFTAEDVVYSFNRLKDPAIKGPFAWRAGNIKDLRAPDPYTVEYELAEAFSELLLQLTMFTNVIHNKESVESLGKDYGIKGADGTGPWCFVSWQPRTEIVLKRHDAYKWGPSMYTNKGPVKFEKLSIRIVPEDSSRVAAMMSGVFEFTNLFPQQFTAQAKAAPMLNVQEAKPNFQLLYYGYKITRPMVADRRVRQAMSIAINRAEIARGVLLGNAEPAFTIVDKDALDHNPSTAGLIKEDVKLAAQLLDEAGWKVGSDGIREKDGVKLAPKVYFTANANSAKVAEAIQGYLRKIGVDWRLQAWDSTIAAAKMAEQDYEIWSVTVPYLSAGDLMNIYFDSKNIPTPNRMNWKDEQTDQWLTLGRTALTAAERAKYYGLVQERAMTEHLWMPVLNINLYLVTNKKLKGARPHMLYANTFYKGLDISF
jgi:peptide/nickel transport system substrate-binding protein